MGVGAVNAATAVLTLKFAEEKALSHSEIVKAQGFDVQAADAAVRSQFQVLLPRLALQGSYSFVSVIPELSFGGPKVKMGSNDNYSIGPVLSYTLWDGGSLSESYQSAVFLSQAKALEQTSAQDQLILNVRMAYLRYELAQEEYAGIQESFKLSQSQNRDISIRYQAGAASRLDVLLASRQMGGYELQLKQKETALHDAKRALFQLMGDPIGDPTTVPLEDFTNLLVFARQLPVRDLAQNPRYQALLRLVAASQKAADALQFKGGPTLQVSATSTLAYPNGPILEQINQTILGASLSIPLWLGDPSGDLSTQKRSQSLADLSRATQLKLDLELAQANAKDAIDNLSVQQGFAKRDLSQSQDIADLHYTAYKLGKVSFVDVQSANTQVLLSRLNLVRVSFQLISQYFTLSSL